VQYNVGSAVRTRFNHECKRMFLMKLEKCMKCNSFERGTGICRKRGVPHDKVRGCSFGGRDFFSPVSVSEHLALKAKQVRAHA
jgi:hypothetical protein